MREELLKILENTNQNRIDADTAEVQVLDLFLVMLSEIQVLGEVTANVIDDGLSDHSHGEAIGFENGVGFVIDEIKKRTHSA